MVPLDRSELRVAHYLCFNLLFVRVLSVAGTFRTDNLWVRLKAKGVNLCLFCGIEMARYAGPVYTQHVEFMKQERNKKTELLQV